MQIMHALQPLAALPLLYTLLNDLVKLVDQLMLELFEELAAVLDLH